MARTIVEVCTCIRCTMMGSMEIAEHVMELQRSLDEDDQPKYDIELVYVSLPELTDEDESLAPVVFVNGEMYTRADSSIIMDAIVRDKERALAEQ